MSKDDTSKLDEAPVTMTALPEVDDAQLKRDLAQARLVAERRVLAAPDIIAGRSKEPDDVLGATVERLKARGIWPKTNGTPDHPFWGDKEFHKHFISQGYQPIVEDRRLVTYKELILYALPHDIYWATEMANSQRSRDRMRGFQQEAAPAVERAKGETIGIRQPMAPPRTNPARPD